MKARAEPHLFGLQPTNGVHLPVIGSVPPADRLSA